jgi:hypothetical protein
VTIDDDGVFDASLRPSGRDEFECGDRTHHSARAPRLCIYAGGLEVAVVVLKIVRGCVT